MWPMRGMPGEASGGSRGSCFESVQAAIVARAVTPATASMDGLPKLSRTPMMSVVAPKNTVTRCRTYISVVRGELEVTTAEPHMWNLLIYKCSKPPPMCNRAKGELWKLGDVTYFHDLLGLTNARPWNCGEK